jgi:osmotically inducible protein OsmC
MSTRNAKAIWEGGFKAGRGTLAYGETGQPYSFASRFESGYGTNPEELLAAAHASCFTMALSKALAEAGRPPTRIETTASVDLDRVNGEFQIVRIHLETEAEVRGVDTERFQHVAETAKMGCIVSKALAGVPEITLKAHLREPARHGPGGSGRLSNPWKNLARFFQTLEIPGGTYALPCSPRSASRTWPWLKTSGSISNPA